MIKSNWNIFKAKFYENPQDNFEWFCYLLFCNEHNQPKGIFRYKNQSAIETEPIEFNNEVIGWQAKFYDVSLSQKNDEILETLKKAKRDYPDITKLIFYTNQEWGQNKGKDPKGKTDAEKEAKKLNIEIEWRVASYFESEFVAIENSHISKYFFKLDTGIEKAIENSMEHTQILLQGINTSINFSSEHIEINRDELIQEIKNTSKQIIVLNGGAGTGKTSLIKKYYEEVKEDIPCYILKATEFLTANLSTLFAGFTVDDFIDAHRDEEDKILVIDSAEKLLDLNDDTTFKELLSILIKNNWKVIFTTRDNYLNDLNYELKEIYQISFENISIKDLTDSDLLALSKEYIFNLPTDIKLRSLIKNPFYLSQYLKFYQKNEHFSYLEFKDSIWQKTIVKSKPAREQCFLEMVKTRANTGLFFVKSNCESSILDSLRDDGILGYESHGYFITHDIYEEWALEKMIETASCQSSNLKDFLTQIGDTLPVRRSFRKWISEKLLLDNKDIYPFIEEVLRTKDISVFWKDEILIAILLSNYAETFFENFESFLKENNFELLQKISFLLRFSCKEVDTSVLDLYNIADVEASLLFTRPYGKGWEAFIQFVMDNIEMLGLNHINWILPVLHDWISKFQEGIATKNAAFIALKFYELINDEEYYHIDEHVKKVCQVIINGSSEIKEELVIIFDQIIENKWKRHSDRYYQLSKMILTSFEGFPISKTMPEYVLKLANLFWRYAPVEIPKGLGIIESDIASDNVERKFGLKNGYEFDYFPSSAFQTPIYVLLQNDFKNTIDFLLDFINTSVEYYAKSDWEAVEEVEVHIGNETIKQYHSSALWNIYRGTSSPVSPYLLQSIHMALERTLLDISKILEVETLEKCLKYLLLKSKSSSISSIVTSIVLACPDKTFNIATILFQAKEFFYADMIRYMNDQSESRSLYSMGYDINYEHKLFREERLKTCDDKHRNKHLENLFLNYQVFRSEKINEEQSESRQKTLWKILDNYYTGLPTEEKQTESDKSWRIALSRMDKRKMDIQIKEVEKGYELTFNAELSPELKEYSENSQKDSSETLKYTALHLWSKNRLENDKDYNKYQEFEENPLVALEKIQEIINIPHAERSFILQKETLPNVCIVLLRDFSGQLSRKEKELCRDIIYKFATMPFDDNYRLQISDGAETAISFLPVILTEFPEELQDVKTILLLQLFTDYRIGMSGVNFYDYAIRALSIYFSEDELKSIILGYLLLKPKFDTKIEKITKETYEQRYEFKEHKNRFEDFAKEHESLIENIVSDNSTIDDLQNIADIELYILNVAFKMIPDGTTCPILNNLVKKIIKANATKLFSERRKEKIQYEVKHEFFKKLATFILQSSKEEIEEYIQPLLNNFTSEEFVADMLLQFVLQEDFLDTYDNFWYVWELFKEKVLELYVDCSRYNSIKNILYTYLLARSSSGEIWKSTAKEWHSLKEKDQRFFKEVSEKIGHCPCVLYSLVKLLNSIGSIYLENGVGIEWIANMIQTHENLWKSELDTNTIYYLEIVIRKYILKNKQSIRRYQKKKSEVLTILDFLVDRGSSAGYMLRENIL